MNETADAALAASAFAVDPHGLGGVCLRSSATPFRDQWVQQLRMLMPAALPFRRMPFNIADSRLLGGLDLVGTLRAGRPVVERGALASTDGGILVVTMAERLGAHTAAALCRVLDHGRIDIAREGVLIADLARVGIVACDESASEDEFVPRCLLDRFAFLLDFSSVTARSQLQAAYSSEHIASARELLPAVSHEDTVVRALCATAMALGAGSARVTMLAVRVARVLAALQGRSEVLLADAENAGRLVLAPRATVAPNSPREDERPSSQQAHTPPPTGDDAPRDDASRDDAPNIAVKPPQPQPQAQAQEIEARVLAATQSAIPRGLLAQLQHAIGAGRSAGGGAGRFGAARKGGVRGRPSGIAKAQPGRSRLNLSATLRAAAPWQALRGRVSGETRLRIFAEDLRMTRYEQRARTLTIFAVDASGSSALNRLAEAKGAVELLLADCYIRRDQVAVIGFRGRSAEILLPPTRSLVRAKRSLAGLPGGGGTPLAAAIDAATVLASQAQRRGESSIVVMLTDGRGNVARDGKSGRDVGHADAARAAVAFRSAGVTGLFVDTSPRPQAPAQELATIMNVAYLALPYADARALSTVVSRMNQPKSKQVSSR